MNSSKLIKLPPVLLRINRENRNGGSQNCEAINTGKSCQLNKVWDRVIVSTNV